MTVEVSSGFTGCSAMRQSSEKERICSFLITTLGETTLKMWRMSKSMLLRVLHSKKSKMRLISCQILIYWRTKEDSFYM